MQTPLSEKVTNMRTSSFIAILSILALGNCSSSDTTAPPTQAPTTSSEAKEDSGKFVKIEEFKSAHIQSRGLTIWLPPNYAAENGPYPVIYAHDGQNLMEIEGSYRGVEWNLDEVSADLIENENARPAIIVGIWNTDKRWWEYAPEKIMSNIPDTALPSEDNPEGIRPELYSDAYLKFIVTELKPYIDANYATAPKRETTAIMGASMGGLISLYALAEYPETFSKAACISTHWPLAQPQGLIADEATQAILTYLETSKLGSLPQSIWFDHGTEELDQYYKRHSTDIEAWFRTNNWTQEQAQFRIYEGTGHKEEDWSSRARDYITFLLSE